MNKLTNAQLERLAKLSEECGEVIQIVSKIIRHGYDSSHPDYKNIPNKALLEKELGDVLAMINMMFNANEINIHSVNLNSHIKLEKQQFDHYQIKDNYNYTLKLETINI